MPESRGRLHRSWCRSWSRIICLCGRCYLWCLLSWHKGLGLEIETLGGKCWLLRGTHRLVRDRELTSIITCLLNVPVKGVALTTRLCSRLSCLSCDVRRCSDGHSRRGRGESRDLGIGKSCKRRKLPKVSRWRPSLGDKLQL